jgi:putative thioredoxin
MSQSSNFSRPGAIDLSGLGQRPAGGAAGAAGPAGAAGSAGRSYDVDVTEASFQADVIERSLQFPVVVEFWSGRSPASQDLGEMLRRLATEYDGKFLLARIDIDRNPGLAQAVGVQAVPLVIGVLRGQVVPLFQGTADEEQARQYVDQLITVAVANGISGRAEPTGSAASEQDTAAAEAAADARYAAAEQALAAGDMDAALAAYEALLAQEPGDAIAKQGLAGAKLMQRTKDLPTDLPARAEAAPDDVALQTQAADVEVLAGQVEAAFGRLIRTVQRTAGDDRETARKHLLDLFEVVGADDPRVAKARQKLMAALF